MKIGFVLDDGLDKPDGVQQYIRTLGEWYQSRGHEVRYLVGQTTRTDIAGVHSMSRNVKVRFNGNAMTIPLPASRKKIKEVLDLEQFDALHVQVPYSPFMGARVIKAAGSNVAVVGTFHILPYGLISFAGTKLLGLWLHRNLKRFDAFVSVSEPAAEFARRTFGIVSDVVPNSVQIMQFKPNKRSTKIDKLSVVFLGRLVHRKGAQQLLKALADLKLKKRLPDNVTVDICGDGQQRQSLETFVNKNNLQDHVTFRGFVSNEDKIRFLQNADIAVFPSISGESFGIVLIEAMAANAGVVLAGNNPGYESVMLSVPETLFDPLDTTAFAGKLNDYITDPKLRASVHERQQKLVTKFDTPVVGEQLLDLYTACKSNRNR